MFALSVVLLSEMWTPAAATLVSDSSPTFTPDNTIILSNAADGQFCRDFSPLLKRLAAPWLILDGPKVPEEARDRNVIIVGRTQAEHTSEVFSQLLTSADWDALKEADAPRIVRLPSPWDAQRTIWIAAGRDQVQVKAAAEQAFDEILADDRLRQDWVTGGESVTSREDLRQYAAQIQWLPSRGESNEEPTLEELTIDVNARTRPTISAQEATEDVQRFFTLLAHGYCGYGFFLQEGDFAAAELAIVHELQSQSRWSTSALSALIHDHLDFIRDCHLRLGELPFCQHQDFWYDTTLLVSLGDAGYSFSSDGLTHTLVGVNGDDPADWLFPSLSLDGDPVYRLGTLSSAEPRPLQVTTQHADEVRTRTVPLARSSGHIGSPFSSGRLGGVPVVRADSFGDYYRQELDAFVESASTYRGEPYVVVDIRGNGGGNTRWPQSWIRGFTGDSLVLRHALTELISRTTRAGRANLFRQAVAQARREDRAQAEAELGRYQAEAERFDDPAQEPYWTALQIPDARFVENDSTLVVVFDGDVASAGEGMLVYLYEQVENVLFVGENSMGALTFGQVTAHQLPNSKLPVTLPVKLNVPTDLQFREGIGYLPDLWVPSADAVDATVAAIRKGTITSRIPVPSGAFDEPFPRQNTIWRALPQQAADIVEEVAPFLVVAGALALIVSLRRKPAPLLAVAGFAIVLGAIAFRRQSLTPGYLFSSLALVSLARGGYVLWRRRRCGVG